MKTRKIFLVLGLAGACALLGLLLWSRRAAVSRTENEPTEEALPPAYPPINQAGPITNLPALSTNLLREVPNAAERLLKLERLGQVPEGADDWDWSLAKYTSWWGKRLDPKTFWKDRVLWLDTSATQAARRRGRVYPPIPYEDPAFASRSDEDQSTLPSADNLDLRLRLSDKENAFWDRFVKTHPHPPEQIDHLQISVAYGILGARYRFEHAGNPARTTEARLKDLTRAERDLAGALGYPPEAFTDEALHWRYVLEKRTEYEQQYIRTQTQNTPSASNFLAQVWVDPKLITEPLTDEQLKAANAWKIAYLQRLRREQVDESYIKAYLKAWNLSAAEVFGSTNQP